MAVYGRLFGNPMNLLYLRNGIFNYNYPIIYKGKTTISTVTVPPKPKKPATPYINFLNEIRPQIVREMPGLKTADILRAAGKRWAEVDSSKKTALQEEFKKQFLKYKEDIATYMNSLTPEQLEQLKCQKKETNAKQKKRVERKMNKKLGMPKRPPSSFILYMLEQKQKFNESTFKDVVKQISESWKQLTAEEKEKYNVMAKQEFDKYKVNLEKWHAEHTTQASWNK